MDVPSFFIALKEVTLFIKRRFDPDHYEGYTFLGEKVSYGGWLYSRVDGGPDRRYHNNKRWKVSIKSWKHLETGEVKTKRSEGFSGSYGDLR